MRLTSSLRARNAAPRARRCMAMVLLRAYLGVRSRVPAPRRHGLPRAGSAAGDHVLFGARAYLLAALPPPAARAACRRSSTDLHHIVLWRGWRMVTEDVSCCCSCRPTARHRCLPACRTSPSAPCRRLGDARAARRLPFLARACISSRLHGHDISPMLVDISIPIFNGVAFSTYSRLPHPRFLYLLLP